MGALVRAMLSRLCRVKPILLVLLLLCTAELYYMRHVEDRQQETFAGNHLPLKTDRAARHEQQGTATQEPSRTQSVVGERWVSSGLLRSPVAQLRCASPCYKLPPLRFLDPSSDARCLLAGF